MTRAVVSELDFGDETLRFTVCAASDVGAVRKINEDSLLASPPVFVVADGMGGHSFGDRASQAAIAAFAGVFPTDAPARPAEVLETIAAANTAVCELTDWAGETRTISGTTLTGVALVTVGAGENRHWMAFNIGDSRVYSWDGRTLAQLSVDHSVVQELVDAGVISKADAATHPERNVVTRALGAAVDVDPDIWLLPALGRQTFLICSDGLTKELGDDEIAFRIAGHELGSTETIAEELVSAAIAAGGSDNVSVVVVEAELIGVAQVASDETREREPISPYLEDTRPRA
ncbi:MAG: protein phosphatase 2C domain-containing protein [Rhodoglobus sp.]